MLTDLGCGCIFALVFIDKLGFLVAFTQTFAFSNHHHFKPPADKAGTT
jgi:hypothetical protein